jgi:hypothetical protein
MQRLQQKFEEASKMAGDEFFRKLDFYVNAWIPARELVKTAIDSRLEVDSSGQIMVFHQASGEVRREDECDSNFADTSIGSISYSRCLGRTTSLISRSRSSRRRRSSTCFTLRAPRSPRASGGSSVSRSERTASRTGRTCPMRKFGVPI